MDRWFLCVAFIIILSKALMGGDTIQDDSQYQSSAARTRPGATPQSLYEAMTRFHHVCAQYDNIKPGSSSALNPLVQGEQSRCAGIDHPPLLKAQRVDTALCRLYGLFYHPSQMQGFMRTFSKNQMEQIWQHYRQVFRQYIHLMVQIRMLNGGDDIRQQPSPHDKIIQIQRDMIHFFHLQGGFLTQKGPSVQEMIAASNQRKKTRGFVDFLGDFMKNFPSQPPHTIQTMFKGYQRAVEDYLEVLRDETHRQKEELNHTLQGWATQEAAIQNPDHLFHRAEDGIIMGGGSLGIQCLKKVYQDLRALQNNPAVAQDPDPSLTRWLEHFCHVIHLYLFQEKTPATWPISEQPHLKDIVLTFKGLQEPIGALTRDAVNITKTILALATTRRALPSVQEDPQQG